MKKIILILSFIGIAFISNANAQQLKKQRTVDGFACYLDSIYQTKTLLVVKSDLNSLVIQKIITSTEIEDNYKIQKIGHLLMTRNVPYLAYICSEWLKQ